MPQSDMAKNLIEQSDLSHIKLVGERPPLWKFQAIQTIEGYQKKQLVHINTDIRNHFAIQREKVESFVFEESQTLSIEYDFHIGTCP